MPELTGVLPVDKPVGPTSHDVVAAARRALRTRRIGHTGTLDPFASGLLLLCVGPATRIAEYLTPLPKTYRAVLRLGEATDTDDLTGEVIGGDDGWAALETERIVAALQSQTGLLQQLPPLFSAKKTEGVRAYDAARRGVAVERRRVAVTVHRIEPLRIEPPEVEFLVECSAGTYIRAIARDVGAELGVGAHLRALRRTASGSVGVERAVALDRLGDAELVGRALIPPADALAHLPRASVDEPGLAALRQGRRIAAAAGLPAGEPVAVVGPAGELAAIAELRGALLQPRKVLA